MSGFSGIRTIHSELQDTLLLVISMNQNCYRFETSVKSAVFWCCLDLVFLNKTPCSRMVIMTGSDV